MTQNEKCLEKVRLARSIPLFGSYQSTIHVAALIRMASALLTDEDIDRLINDEPDPTPQPQQGQHVYGANDPFLSQLLDPQPDAATEHGDASQSGGAIRSIWGTSLQITTVQRATFDFIAKFQKAPALPGAEPYYMRLLEQVRMLFGRIYLIALSCRPGLSA